MISMPVPNYPVAEDLDSDSHMDTNDIDVKLTYVEHEMICEVLCQAATMMDFASPYGMFDLPIDSDIVQRYTMIENLRERFNTAWSDRFSTDSNNEIH